MQLKRLERIVKIDGVLHYYWRYSNKPMIETPRGLALNALLRARLDIDRRCSYGERRYHALYAYYWGKVSFKESIDIVNPRWGSN